MSTEHDRAGTGLAGCLRVVLLEHVEHRRYAVRDLAVLTAPAG